MKKMNVTVAHYFTDCAKDDPEATSRLYGETVEQLIQAGIVGFHLYPPQGVPDNLSAGFCAGSVLARATMPTLVMFNAAPRSDVEHDDHTNGAPFAYTFVKGVRGVEHLVVGTFEGEGFAALQRLLGQRLTINVMNIHDVVTGYYGIEDLIPDQIYMATSQFRSLDFVPWVAARLATGERLNATEVEVPEITDPSMVGYVDRFGNLKLLITLRDLIASGVDVKKTLYLRRHGSTDVLATLEYYPRGLTTIPRDLLGLTVGSTGNRRMEEGLNVLELQIRMQSAAAKLGLTPGTRISLKNE